MGNKFKDLAKDTLIFAIGNIGSKLILFFLVPLYSVCLTKQQYGTSDLVFTIAQLILPFVSVVIYDALIRFGLSKDEKTEDVLLASYIVLGIGMVATILITPLIGFYEPVSNWKWFLTIYVILSAFNASNMNYLKVKNRIKSYTVISLVQTVLIASLSIVLLAVLHWGVEGFLAANIISMAVAVFISIIVAKIPGDLKKSCFRKELLIKMTKYSTPLILNNVSWWVVHSSDKVMVERMLDAASLGLYTVAAKIPALINVIINIFTQAWGISSVKEFENSNDTRFYSSVLEGFAFICFCVSIILVGITKPFMKLYVSESFYDSWHYVPILLSAAAFAAIAYYYGSLYGALKFSGRNMVTTMLAAIVNIIVNFVGIMLAGIYGAAIGTLVAYIVMAFVRMIDVGHYIKIQIKWPRFFILCLLSILQAILVTLDFYVYIVSIVVFILVVILYRDLVSKMFKSVKSMIHR